MSPARAMFGLFAATFIVALLPSAIGNQQMQGGDDHGEQRTLEATRERSIEYLPGVATLKRSAEHPGDRMA